MYLVMLETNGNQRYIFSSPRLRENIGASAQLARLPGWVEDALTTTNVADGWEKAHPRPQDDSSGLSTQWVSRASGKVILRVDEKEQARAVVRRVTRSALEEAPGIDVSGVFVEMEEETVTACDLKKVHAEAARYALRRPPASARFSRMPFLAQADDSVLPAAPPLGVDDESRDDREAPLSLESRVKRYQAYWSRKELIDLACGISETLETGRDLLVRDPTQLSTLLLQSFPTFPEREQAASGGQQAAPDGTHGDGAGSSQDASGTAGSGSEEEARTRRDDLAEARKRATALEYRLQSNTPRARRRRKQDSSDRPSPGEKVPLLPRVAVIHADGNGVGAIMRNLDRALTRVPRADFEKAVGCTKDDPDALRRFVLAVSRQLDTAVKDSFARAWTDIACWAEQDVGSSQQAFTVVPVVPVILGGDDVTAITTGDYALPFAASYLSHYEEATCNDTLLRHLHDIGHDADRDVDGEAGATSSTGTHPDAGSQQQPVEPGPMTAAAGVVITRNGFPFYTAYDLAERLVARAKKVARSQVPARSVLTYHALLDSTVLDADQVLDAYSSFTTRPYLLTGEDDDAAGEPPAGTADAPRTGQDVAEHASWPEVCRWVSTFKNGVDKNGVEEERHRGRGSGKARTGAERLFFPRTRAVRIRRYLSDAAQARLANEQGRRKRLERTAEREWEAARKALDCPRLVEGIGGRKETLFDLLELADLLPGSYLGRPATADHHDPMAAAFEESQV